MNKEDLCFILLLVAGLAALSHALPSNVLKFQPQQHEYIVEDTLFKTLAKSKPHAALDQSIQFFSKWGINPNNRIMSNKWSDCGNSSSKIIFKGLEVTPDPIELPGTIKLSFNIKVEENIPDSLSADVELTKIMDSLHIPLPCIDNIGSCQYKVCPLLSQIKKCPDVLTKNHIPCSCPIKEGDYIFPVTGIPIPGDPVPEGDYTARIVFTHKETFLGCLSLAASFKAK